MSKMIFIIPAILLTLTACGTTQLSPNWDRRAKPAYVDYTDGYFFWIVGSDPIDPARACVDQKPLAIRRVKTFEDVFLAVVTIGIYTPTTVKVWCGN